MTTEQIEPITIVLPTLKQSVVLRPETAAVVWDAVKRGIASSPEEYINRALHQFLRERRVARGDASDDRAEESPMSKAIENLQAAQQRAIAGRPKVGGFPYLAETFRRAGVTRNFWFLPACQSLYLTNDGPVVTQGTPLVTGTADVPPFSREALIAALRIDQAGKSTFPEFLAASWRARVVRYDVDFAARTVSYYGSNGEAYVEEYPAVEVE
jgi:uncharacterized protein YbcV (DUF1398 family)